MHMHVSSLRLKVDDIVDPCACHLLAIHLSVASSEHKILRRSNAAQRHTEWAKPIYKEIKLGQKSPVTVNGALGTEPVGEFHGHRGN